MLIIAWTALFVLLGVLAGATENMIFFGAALLTLGMLFFYLALKKMALDGRAVILSAIYVCIWGIMTIIAAVMNSNYEGWIFAEGFGGAFLGLGIRQGIVKLFVCKEKITACFLEVRSHSSVRGGTFYEPVFGFVYKNRQYKGTTGEVFRRRKLEKKYQMGNWYTIYINPRNPNVMCIRRCPQGAAVLMICIGVVCMGMPFWIM